MGVCLHANMLCYTEKRKILINNYYSAILADYINEFFDKY